MILGLIWAALTGLNVYTSVNYAMNVASVVLAGHPFTHRAALVFISVSWAVWTVLFYFVFGVTHAN